jgi:P27 family predicted phage terminase small subunit
MGRRPDPLERKAARAKGSTATLGGRPVTKSVAVTGNNAVDIPAEPENLQERGSLEWRKIWTAGFWLKSDQDYPWIEQVVRAYDDIEVFRKRVEDDGLVQTGSMGQPVAHPLIAEIRKCEETIRKCLSVLGFSPTDRARLGLAEAKARSMLADLLKGPD